PVAVDVAAHLAQDGAAAPVAEEAGERVMEVATELEEPLWMFAEEDHLLDHPIEAIELLRGDGAGDLLDDGLLDHGAEPEEVTDVLGVDVGHDQASAGQAVDESLGFQLLERLPKRRPTDREPV